MRNLSPIHPGEPYSREKLEVYQRRLTATNYFASVQVAIDADPARPGELPVRVSLIEAPKRKVDVGVGYSTDTLFRFQLDYRDVNVFGSNHRLTSTLRYEIEGAVAGRERRVAARHGRLVQHLQRRPPGDADPGPRHRVGLGRVRAQARRRAQPAGLGSRVHLRAAAAGRPAVRQHLCARRQRLVHVAAHGRAALAAARVERGRAARGRAAGRVEPRLRPRRREGARGSCRSRGSSTESCAPKPAQ